MTAAPNQLAFAAADPIDERNPLVLPPLRSRWNPRVDPMQGWAGHPVSAAFSGSVAAETGPSRELAPALPPPSAPGQTTSRPTAPPLEAGSLLRALEPIIAERRRQFEEFGHTVEQDLALRPGKLPDRAIRYLVNAQEDLQFRRGDFIANARRHLAQAGAMVLAAIDYLDAGGGR